jgi:hypothetical protein
LFKLELSVHFDHGQISVFCRLGLMLRSLTFSFVYISALARTAYSAQSFTSYFHQLFHHNKSESLLSSLSLVFLSRELSLNSCIMALESRKGSSTIASTNKAINIARPIRSVQAQSPPRSFKIFTFTDSRRETVADALSHLLPSDTSSPTPTGEHVMIQDDNEETGPGTSPLIPVHSPLTPAIEEDATAGAEASPIDEQLIQQHSPTRNKRKRKAGSPVPVTPPPRRVRKKKSVTTSGGNAPAPGLLANLARNIENVSNIESSSYIESSSNIETSTTSVIDVTEPGPDVEQPSHDSVDNALERAASDKSNAKDVLDKTLAVAHNLLKRQRVLIHDYDAFDVKTYSPRGHVDEGTVALREFTDILRTGLYEMEEHISELADL